MLGAQSTSFFSLTPAFSVGAHQEQRRKLGNISSTTGAPPGHDGGERKTFFMKYQLMALSWRVTEDA
jgi:hypothetical protein